MIRLFSFAWSVVNALRRRLFVWGVLGSRQLPVPVVSVGNLQAGGSGKTPIVVALLKEAVLRGRVPLVLMRGYRGSWSRTGGVIPPGVGVTDPELCGDEAALIHEQVPEAWIGVGADRGGSFDQVNAAAAEAGIRAPDWVVLDDGHQHLALARDVEVLALTPALRGERLFREWSGARYGSHVPCFEILTKGGNPASGLPRMELCLPSPMAGEGSERLWAVSGIGSPADFEASLRKSGWKVERRTDFPDHARYSPDWIAACLDEAGRLGLRVAVTGKDWVKWRGLGAAPGSVRVFEPLPTFVPEGFAAAVVDASMDSGQKGACRA